jgi:hypothetical protein
LILILIASAALYLLAQRVVRCLCFLHHLISFRPTSTLISCSIELSRLPPPTRLLHPTPFRSEQSWVSE